MVRLQDIKEIIIVLRKNYAAVGDEQKMLSAWG